MEALPSTKTPGLPRINLSRERQLNCNMSPKNNALDKPTGRAPRCCLYLRKSQADDPNESIMETLARHEKRLRNVAEQNGHHIAHVYREVVSGETIAAREQIKELLNNAKEWDYVYCVREDRLARGDSVDQGLVIRAFMASNTKIVTPFKVFDLSNRSDQQFFEVSLFLARMEYRFITERMKDGLRDSLEEGQYLGRFSPYGYDKWINERDQKTLVPNNDAPIVQMMFYWSAFENKSYYRIAKDLTAMGIKAPRGDEWSKSTVGEILRNEVYLGKIRWGRHKTSNAFTSDGYNQSKEKKLLAAGDYDIFDGLHDALVDPEVFEMSLRNAKGRTPIHHGDALRSPVAGLLVCKKCGRAMQFMLDRRYGKYRFQHKNVSAKKCDREKGAPVDLVMDALKDHLMKTLGDMKLLVTDDGAAKEAERIESTIAALEKDLASIDYAQDMLLQALEVGGLTPELFAKRNAVHDERRAKIIKAVADLRESMPDQVAVEERIVQLSECIEVMGNWREDAPAINDFLKTFIRRIEYSNPSEHGKHDKLTLEVFYIPPACSRTE